MSRRRSRSDKATKPGVVIVGAGLAGSILASRLRARYTVTVVDLRDTPAPLPTPIADMGVPSRLDVHAGAGPGGTTNFWYNGLIEIEDEDYASWPVTKAELGPYVSRSLELLSGVRQDDVSREDAVVRARLVERGVPSTLLGKSLFCPLLHRNIWSHLGLPGGDVECVTGVAQRFEIADGTTKAVIVETASGTRRIEGDVFIASAGGLSSPALLSATAESSGLRLPAIGRYYHDHPMGSVGQMTLDLKLHDALKRRTPAIRGALRIPFVTRVGDTKFAFYLRTQELNRHRSARSALRKLHKNPTVWRNYWEVLSKGRGVIEVLLFRIGVDIPTSTFSIRMVAEQPPSDTLTLSRHADGSIVRNWTLAPDFSGQVERAIQEMLAALGNHVVNFTLDPEWQKQLQTAAHHSGGCRMAKSPDRGVCDRDMKVFGTDNLYVCDGSALPSSGYANTGLMIGALALRLADHLIADVPSSPRSAAQRRAAAPTASARLVRRGPEAR